MIRSFADRETERIFQRKSSRRFGSIERVALRKLVMIHAATAVKDLRVPPGNRLETLSGDRKGQFSIRVNQQWRICFRFKDGDAYDVEICDYH